LEKNILENFISKGKNIIGNDFEDYIILISLFMASSVCVYEKAMSEISNNIKNMGKVEIKSSVNNFILALDKDNENSRNTVKYIKKNNLDVLKKIKPFLEDVIDLDNKYTKIITPYLIWCFHTNMAVKNIRNIENSKTFHILEKYKKILTFLNSDKEKQKKLIFEIKEVFESGDNGIFDNIRDFIYCFQPQKSGIEKNYINKFKYSLFTIKKRKYNEKRKYIGKDECIGERNRLNYFLGLLFNTNNCNYTLSVLLFDRETLLFRQIPATINVYYFMIFCALDMESKNIDLDYLTDIEKIDNCMEFILNNSNKNMEILINEVIDFLVNNDIFKEYIIYIAEEYKISKASEKVFDLKYQLSYAKETYKKHKVNLHQKYIENYCWKEDIKDGIINVQIRDFISFIKRLGLLIEYAKNLKNEDELKEINKEIRHNFELIDLLYSSLNKEYYVKINEAEDNNDSIDEVIKTLEVLQNIHTKYMKLKKIIRYRHKYIKYKHSKYKRYKHKKKIRILVKRKQ
jgi:hypothetical protein